MSPTTESTPLKYAQAVSATSKTRDDESYGLETSETSESYSEMPGDPPDIPTLSCRSFCCTPIVPGRSELLVGLLYTALYPLGGGSMLIYGALNNGTMPDGAPVKSSTSAAIGMFVCALPLLGFSAYYITKGVNMIYQHYTGPHELPPPSDFNDA